MAFLSLLKKKKSIRRVRNADSKIIATFRLPASTWISIRSRNTIMELRRNLADGAPRHASHPRADGNKDAVRARGRYCTARTVRARSGYGLRRSAESCVFITEINGAHLHFCIARTAFGENSLRAYVAKERERETLWQFRAYVHMCAFDMRYTVRCV